MSAPTPIVIVVDNDPAMLKALERLLRARGYASEVFTSAESFLARPSDAPVACMILDIDLGGMSGLELRRRLVGAGNAPPVIFITGQSDGKTHALAEQLGCVAYLKKPFAADALTQAITRAMARPAPRPEPI
jgi:FixJ family two-component response regulator